MSLAEWGRKEISIAEQEMPGLMSIRRKYAVDKPLQGVRVTGSLHMTIQTAVLIGDAGRFRRHRALASCNIFSTQDHAAAAIAAAGVPVFAWKGESLEDYWWCTYQAVSHTDGKGPQLVVDDGGDVTAADPPRYELENGSNWVNTPSDSTKRRSSRTCSRKSTPRESQSLAGNRQGLARVSEETTPACTVSIKCRKKASCSFPR